MSDPSSDAAVDESDDCCATFLEWLSANGADTCRLQWPCFSWPGLPHDGVRGVAARTPIDAGDVMFRIPGSLLIDRRTCLASDIGAIFMDNPSLFSSLDEVALSLFVSHETFCKGAASFWWPFIQNLPRSPGFVYFFCFICAAVLRLLWLLLHPRTFVRLWCMSTPVTCFCCRINNQLEPSRIGFFARH